MRRWWALFPGSCALVTRPKRKWERRRRAFIDLSIYFCSTLEDGDWILSGQSARRAAFFLWADRWDFCPIFFLFFLRQSLLYFSLVMKKHPMCLRQQVVIDRRTCEKILMAGQTRSWKEGDDDPSLGANNCVMGDLGTVRGNEIGGDNSRSDD